MLNESDGRVKEAQFIEQALRDAKLDFSVRWASRVAYNRARGIGEATVSAGTRWRRRTRGPRPLRRDLRAARAAERGCLMKSVANPFSRPSAAPENPEVLSLSDYRAPVTPPATSAPDAAAVAVVPSVAPSRSRLPR